MRYREAEKNEEKEEEDKEGDEKWRGGGGIN